MPPKKRKAAMAPPAPANKRPRLTPEERAFRSQARISPSIVPRQTRSRARQPGASPLVSMTDDPLTRRRPRSRGQNTFPRSRAPSPEPSSSGSSSTSTLSPLPSPEIPPPPASTPKTPQPLSRDRSQGPAKRVCHPPTSSSSSPVTPAPESSKTQDPCPVAPPPQEEPPQTPYDDTVHSTLRTPLHTSYPPAYFSPQNSPAQPPSPEISPRLSPPPELPSRTSPTSSTTSHESYATAVSPAPKIETLSRSPTPPGSSPQDPAPSSQEFLQVRSRSPSEHKTPLSSPPRPPIPDESTPTRTFKAPSSTNSTNPSRSSSLFVEPPASNEPSPPSLEPGPTRVFCVPSTVSSHDSDSSDSDSARSSISGASPQSPPSSCFQPPPPPPPHGGAAAVPVASSSADGRESPNRSSNNSDKENARPSPRTDDDLLRPVHPGVRAFSEPCGRATTPLHDLYPPGSQRRRNSSPEVLRHKPSFKADFSFNPTREPLAPLTNSYLQDVDVRVPTAAVSPRDKISFTKPQSQSPQLQTTPPRKTVPIAQYNPTFDRYSQVTPEQYDDPFADIIGLNDDQPCAFSPENRYISAPSKRQLKKRKRTQDTSDSVVEENWTCLSFCLGGRECWSCQTKRATTSNTLINPLETPPPPPPRTLFPHNGSRTPSPLRLTGSPPTSSPMAPNLTSTNNNTNPPRTPTTPTSPRSPEITAYRKRIKSDPEIEPFDGSADHDWEQPSKRLRLSITKKLEIDPKRAAILSPGDEITREVRSVTVKREEDSPIKSRWLMGAPSPSPTAPKGGSETPIPSSKTGGVTEGSKKDMGFFPAGFVWGGLLSQP